MQKNNIVSEILVLIIQLMKTENTKGYSAIN